MAQAKTKDVYHRTTVVQLRRDPEYGLIPASARRLWGLEGMPSGRPEDQFAAASDMASQAGTVQGLIVNAVNVYNFSKEHAFAVIHHGRPDDTVFHGPLPSPEIVMGMGSVTLRRYFKSQSKSSYNTPEINAETHRVTIAKAGETPCFEPGANVERWYATTMRFPTAGFDIQITNADASIKAMLHAGRFAGTGALNETNRFEWETFPAGTVIYLGTKQAARYKVGAARRWNFMVSFAYCSEGWVDHVVPYATTATDAKVRVDGGSPPETGNFKTISEMLGD